MHKGVSLVYNWIQRSSSDQTNTSFLQDQIFVENKLRYVCLCQISENVYAILHFLPEKSLVLFLKENVFLCTTRTNWFP